MIPKKLTQVGNPIIRKKTKPVKNVHAPEIQLLIKDLAKALRTFSLVGVAANQVGADAQIFLTEIRETGFRRETDEDGLRVFINPKILKRSKKQTELIEGCGSLAHSGLFGPVRRPEKVTVTALNENGERFTLEATGLLAKVIQHEYDHLQGINIIDKFSDTRKVFDRENF